MRSNNEISSKEFLDYKEKYDSKIDDLKQSFNKIVDMEKNNNDLFSSTSVLNSTIHTLLDLNDDSVLSISSSLFEKVTVETLNQNEDKKVVLHCNLKLADSEPHNLSLSEISLFLRGYERLYST